MYSQNISTDLQNAEVQEILRTTIIEDLGTTSSAVCNHYFDFCDNTGNKSGYKGFLLNMVQHFSHSMQEIHPAVEELYSQCKIGQQVHQPSKSQLEDTLDVIIQQITSAYIVLDAMDECNVEERAYASKWVERISEKIPIAVTSRDCPNGQEAHTVLRIIELNSRGGGIEEDISIFLQKQIPIHFKGDTKDHILDTLKANAHGQ